MNARAYFTILRPGRTIAATSLILFFAFIVLVVPLGLSLTDFAFVTVCLLLPLTLGSLLLAPLHEVAHRSTFPLLPGGDTQLFRSHVIAFAAAAIPLFGLAALCVATIPAPAAFGLIVTCLALPLLNPKRGKNVGYNPPFGLLLVIGVAIATLARAELIVLARVAPWSLCFGGILISIACFRLGFARDRLRARSANPLYYAPQSTLLFVGTDILQHAQAETARRAEQRSNRPGANWSVTTFHDKLRDWLRIIHHSRFGKTRWLRTEFNVFFAITLATIVALSIGALGHAGLDPQLWEEYCRLAAAAALGSGEIANSDIRLIFVMIPQIGFTAALTSAIVAAVPTRPFPLGRTRLADVLFLSFERRALVALAGNAAGAIIVLSTTALVADQPWSVALFHRILPIPALTLITANLGPMVLFSRDVFVRIGFVILVFPSYLFATFAVILWDFGPTISTLGAALLAALAVGSTVFARATFRRHYRTCDLTRASDCLNRLGFRVA